jgi:hypothetical protein
MIIKDTGGCMHVGCKLLIELGLFPGRKVPAFVKLVIVDEFGIRPLCPASRDLIDLVREDAHGNRDRDIFDVEVASYL